MDVGLSSIPPMPCHAMPLHPEEQEYFTVFGSLLWWTTNLPLPCKLDGQPLKAQWTLVDTSSETSFLRNNCSHPKIFSIQNRPCFAVPLSTDRLPLMALELLPLTDPQHKLTCCAFPRETRPSGRSRPGETKGFTCSSFRTSSCPAEHGPCSQQSQKVSCTCNET